MKPSVFLLRLRATTAAAACVIATVAPRMALAQVAAPSPVAATPLSTTVIITGNPLGADALATPATVLSGDKLVLRRGTSLGDTLDGLPGVSSSYFGPNANRPIIRGQDGDRIRVLSNAGASLDASSLSFDHAVPIDPLVVERIEVLRGPAALLYGGSAVGGVVNAIDNRIPRSPLQGTSGTGELRFGGAANQRGASGLVETGGNGFALHADAFWRKTDDLRVPAFDRPVGEGASERRERITDSASDAKGAALGGSAVWAHGFLGAAADTYRNNYGAVVEDGIVIRMKRDKLAFAGEVRDLSGLFGTLRGQIGHTDYQHQEVQSSGEVGTTFKTQGTDYRFEAVHGKRPLGAGELEGVFGLQGESSSFEALGEEAFVPSTRTRQAAAFVFEQWSFGPGATLSAGLRYERVKVDSKGDADPAELKFGPAQQRRFSPRNAAVGMLYRFSPEWQFSANAAYTERAPAGYEIYANGVHAATGAFERGDLQQKKERGRNLDLGVLGKRGADQLKVSGFVSRFGNYIALVPTGEPEVVEGDRSFPVFAFRGVPARLVGFELEAQKRLLEGSSFSLTAEGHIDWVRGDNLASGEPLPRIAPVRMTMGLNGERGSWSGRAEVQHARRQDRVASTDSATPAWTMVNLSASYKVRLGSSDAMFFAKISNLGNRLAYNATTIQTVRPLAPLGGRALSAGLRLTF